VLKGCDVSAYQGPPGDWVRIAGDIDFAAVKFTELSSAGPYLSPDAAADWASLAAAGKLRMAYFYGHPSASVSETVALFEGAVRTAGLGDDDMVMLDFETTDGRDPSAVASWADAVLGLLRRDLDRMPVCYTYLNFAWTGNCAGLGDYPLFISDPSSPPGEPRIPAPWTSWTLHQHSITGDIDRDVANFASHEEMAAALGRPGPAPKPAPESAPQSATGDDDMFISLPPGERVVFAPWTDITGKAAAPYSNVSLILAGETGAQVTATVYRGVKSFPHAHDLISGTAVDGGPAHGWAGVTAVVLARTDTDTNAMASGVLTRW
jgi:GH25 family lysozyme M1 (1,4-beta-N-acetylmuramidase)